MRIPSDSSAFRQPPFRVLATVAAITLLVATNTSADEGENAFAGSEITSYFGHDDCIKLFNDHTSVVLCPAVGGRVLDYSLDGTNLLYLPSGRESWKSEATERSHEVNAGRFDIGPEKIVRRGQVLWSGQWKGEMIADRRAKMVSQFDPVSGVRLIREFHLHESESQLRCTQTIVNESKRPVELCHWSRTFVVGGGVAVVPRSKHQRFPNGYVLYEGGNSISLRPQDPMIDVSKEAVVVHGPPKQPKLGFDSHAGWLAYASPTNHLFVKRFKTFPDRMYNEAAGLTVSIWYPEKDRVELEPIGPAEYLKPGQRASFTEQWWILPHEFPKSRDAFEFKDIERKVERHTRSLDRDPNRVISPQMHADQSVTLRAIAGDAEQVHARVDNKQHPMTRDVDGVWKVTLADLDPGIHEYTFDIDGVRVTDPHNRFLKKWFQCASMFEIKGDPAPLTQRTDVPHGVIHRHCYNSSTTKTQRDALVYTPPGYRSDSERGYPLLVLCHGHGDDETAWTEVGRMHHIMDNLIARGEAKPMVVVMPNGHPIDPHTRTWSEDYNDRNKVVFVEDVIHDLLPVVQEHYNISRESLDRAITGLSMGGGHSIGTVLRYPDMFRWVGAFSAAAPTKLLDAQFPQLVDEVDDFNEKHRLFWIACGKKDFLLERNRDFVAQLKKHDLRHQYVETQGDHSWSVWRRYFPQFVKLLFRE